jgi:predicted glutamine amidotransferase
MCGLVGMILNTTNGPVFSDVTAFEELLYIDALRGEDSTGVAALYNNGDMQVIKDSCDANYFRSTKEFTDFKRDFISKGRVVLGHNRKKTVGKIDPTTAHPFLINDRFAFTHNGTLHNHKKLANTEVDSEALGIHLTECEGSLVKLEKALAEVEGAFACAWIDQQTEKVFLLRNTERPLYLAKTQIGYIYASEPAMITLVALRNRIKIDSIDPVDTDTLYTFSLPKIYGVDLTKDKLVYTPKKAKPTTYHGSTKVVGMHSTVKAANNFLNSDVYGTSKNAFKRFRNKNLGKVVPFYVEDFVEKNYPQNDGDWLLFGKCDSLEVNHMVCGVVKNATMYAIEEDYMNHLAYGQILNVEYDEISKLVKISVGSITLAKPHEAALTKH